MAEKELHHKSRLPYGWIVRISKTYPDRLYYFNLNTGYSSWECPQLTAPADSITTNEESDECVPFQKPERSKVTVPSEKQEGSRVTFSMTNNKPKVVMSDHQEDKQNSKYNKHSDEKLPSKSVMYNSNSRINNCTKTAHSLARVAPEISETKQTGSIGPKRLRFKLKRPKSLKSLREGAIHEQKQKNINVSTQNVQQNDKKMQLAVKSDKLKPKPEEKFQSSGKRTQPLAKVMPLEKAHHSQNDKLLIAEITPMEKSTQCAKKMPQLQNNSVSKIRQVPEKIKFQVKRTHSAENRVQLLEKVYPVQRETLQAVKKGLQPLKRVKSPEKRIYSLEKGVQPPEKKMKSAKKEEQLVVKKVQHLGKRVHYTNKAEHQIFLQEKNSLCSSNSSRASGYSSFMPSTCDSTFISIRKPSLPLNAGKDELSQSLCQEGKSEEERSTSDAEMLDVSTELTSMQILYEPMQTDDICETNMGFCIVVDTNVLISDLMFVDELKDLPLEGSGPPTIYIPWVVIQELDVLKDNKNKKVSEASSSQAGNAVRYLHAWLTAQHPRIKGQTATESRSQKKNLPSQSNDDAILHCCLQLAKKVTNDRLILLTNDKNLCNKAIIHDIKAYTRDSLLKHVKVDFADKTHTITRGEYTISVPLSNTLSSLEMKKEVDKLICQMKMKLKQVLEPVLTNGMKNVFGDEWPSFVIISPPWSLLDILFCLKKHWIAVFGSIFTRIVQNNVEIILKELKLSKGYVYDEMQADKMLSAAVELCVHIHRRCGGLNVTQEMKGLKSACSLLCTKSKEQSKKNFTIEVVDDPHTNHIKVLAVFQHIWDLLNHLCGVILDSLHCHHNFNYSCPEILPSREEVLHFMPKFYPQLQQLKQKMSSVILPDPEIPYRRTVSQLFCVLHTIVPNLEVQAEEPPLSGISEDILFDFCNNENNKDLLQNGYRQLIQFFDAIHKCIHGAL